jgi:hypothetical protein
MAIVCPDTVFIQP